MNCGRKMMMAGRTEDLKAIWDNVVIWRVYSDDGDLMFFKEEEEGAWEGVEGHRRGLEALSDMTEEEWLEELREYGEIYDDSEEEDGTGSEEGEDLLPE